MSRSELELAQWIIAYFKYTQATTAFEKRAYSLALKVATKLHSGEQKYLMKLKERETNESHSYS